MKTQKRIQICSLIAICIVYFFANSCKKEEPVAIIKTDPIITWANPADIVYGTLLSATQLNATANVSGTFVYTPGIGTKLDAGTNQILKVDFTPTDSTKYNNAKKTVTINVQTPISIPSTTVTDIDGNEYHTVIIGTQTWMVENLKTTKYNDNTEIFFAANNADWSQRIVGAYCWYNDDASKKATYGALYNWLAVKTGKLAPIGWHVSTNTDWNTLLKYLAIRGCGITGSNDVAKALASAIGWNSHTGEGTVGNTDYQDIRNISGFTALPAGYRVDNGSFYQGVTGFYWTSTQYVDDLAWLWTIHYNKDYPWNDYYPWSIGCSVRCVKDN